MYVRVFLLEMCGIERKNSKIGKSECDGNGIKSKTEVTNRRR